MTENFKQNYISTVAAALVAALPTRAKAKPASRGTTAAQVAASFDMDHKDDDYDRIDTVPREGHGQIDKSLVSNIVATEMMRMQK